MMSSLWIHPSTTTSSTTLGEPLPSAFTVSSLPNGTSQRRRRTRCVGRQATRWDPTKVADDSTRRGRVGSHPSRRPRSPTPRARIGRPNPAFEGRRSSCRPETTPLTRLPPWSTRMRRSDPSALTTMMLPWDASTSRVPSGDHDTPGSSSMAPTRGIEVERPVARSTMETPADDDAIAIAVPSGDHDSAEIPSTVVRLVRSPVAGSNSTSSARPGRPVANASWSAAGDHAQNQPPSKSGG